MTDLPTGRRFVASGLTVENGEVVWRLAPHEAESLAYILVRERSWEQDGHLLLEAALPEVES